MIENFFNSSNGRRRQLSKIWWSFLFWDAYSNESILSLNSKFQKLYDHISEFSSSRLRTIDTKWLWYYEDYGKIKWLVYKYITGHSTSFLKIDFFFDLQGYALGSVKDLRTWETKTYSVDTRSDLRVELVARMQYSSPTSFSWWRFYVPIKSKDVLKVRDDTAVGIRESYGVFNKENVTYHSLSNRGILKSPFG